MMTTDTQFLPSAYKFYVAKKSAFVSPTVRISVDRFFQKYELAASFVSIKTKFPQNRFSRDATLLGLILAFKAYEEIATLNYQFRLIDTEPEFYRSDNELLCKSLLSNGTLCSYLKQTVYTNNVLSMHFMETLDEKNRNVMIFGCLIFQAYLDHDFTPRNLGIQKAKEKHNICMLKEHVLDVADTLFSNLTNSIKGSANHENSK